MKSCINQVAHGTSDTSGTSNTKLNATCAINATCAMCQSVISKNGYAPVQFRKR
ncbi:MAG: hypothetical protein GX808_10055 [Syntrophomonadaceae bacterium]|nr:hypothetical protein [Syntrophomonadaceae bacterium]